MTTTAMAAPTTRTTDDLEVVEDILANITPTIEKIPVSKLSVDDDVQRPLDRGRIDVMIAPDPQTGRSTFRLNALGVLTVSRRDDGIHHIVDGRHRAAATVAAGFPDHEMTCEVFEGLTKAQEAALFRLLNNARPVSVIDRFRVRVIEGDSTAVTLNRILTAHGWTVRGGRSGGSFGAISALESVYRGQPAGDITTAEVISMMMDVITEAFGHDTDGARREIVSSLGAFLLRYGASRPDLLPKLTHELRLLGAGTVCSKIKGAYAFNSGRLADAGAEWLTAKIANKGKQERNWLPAWKAA